MGFDRSLKAIHLEKTDKLLLMGAIGGPEFAEKVLGIKDCKSEEERLLAMHKALDVDMLYTLGETGEQPSVAEETEYGTFEKLKKGFPYTDAFHIAYKDFKLARSKAASQLWVIERPFKTYKQLLEYLKDYDPREYETRSVSEISRQYKETYKKKQDFFGDVTLVAGEFYLTLWTFFLIHIGHTFLARLILKNPSVLEDALSKYAEAATKHVEAWSKTGIKAFVSHDDICTQLGPMVDPRLYRRYLFPLYKEIWRPIKERGIKLMFVSDGDYTLLMDDLVEAGVEGFHIEWDPRFSHETVEALVKKYGQTKILITGPEWDVMTYGTVEQARAQAKWISSLAKTCPAFFLSDVTGTLVNQEAFYQTWVKNRER